MTEKKQIYKCDICGNIVELVHGGADALVCCGQDMKLMEEQTADWKGEKHVPFIKVLDGNMVEVSIGIEADMAHPMTEDHYIEWIELISENGLYQRKFLSPGDEPKATFMVEDPDNLSAREYCNIHGLWKA